MTGGTSKKWAWVVIAVAAAAGPGRADEWVPGKRMTKATARIMAEVLNLPKTSKVGYADDISIIGGFFSNNAKKTFTRIFEADTTYWIIGGGDSFVKDFDLSITDKSGSRQASDTDDDPSPVVKFTPETTGRYEIHAHLADGDAKAGGFCVVAVLKAGGWKVPLGNLERAVGNLSRQCEAYNQLALKGGFNIATFHSGKSQWALFGGIVNQNDSLGVRGIVIEEGEKAIATGADTTAKDIDLFLRNEDGKTLKKDVDDDPRPVILYKAEQGMTIEFEAKNVESNGGSLVLVALLQTFKD
jgi:hypothetical protein